MPIRHGAGSVFGGNSPPAQAVESANTLQTVATARAVFLVGEGVCGGLANGAQSVYFDDTPLQNPDGSFNFQNVGVEVRFGDPDQQPLAGFPAVEIETAVGVAVVAATPIVRTITDAAATAVRVTVGFPALVAIDAGTGNSNATSVIFAIDIQPSGQLYATALQQTITDKCTSPQQLSFRVPLAGSAPWNIRVRRVTADSTSSMLQNATTWVSFTELQDYRLKYDNSALVGITFDAKVTGGRIPTVALDWLGCAVEVPTNYDPIARTYSGFWDGTFKTARHSNPAWWFWALATHKRFGLGELVEASFTDKWALFAIGQWCDGLVPNGKGGFEPRLSFNAQINTADDAIKALTTLASTFWGQVYWGPGGLMATADKPSDPADRKKLVVAANTIDAHIEYTESALKAQHSVVVVTWYDPGNLCKATKESVEDRARIARYGRRIKEVIKPGCTSQAEAHRFGSWILETEASDEIAAWSASWDQADFLPGELAYISDRTVAGLRMGGRLGGTVTSIGAGITGVVLDDTVTLNPGESYTVSVVMPDGTIADRPVITPASSTNTLSFNAALPDAPIGGAVWALTSTALAPRPFRVISRGEDAKNLFPLVAQEHDPTKYARIERGINLANPPFTALLTGPIAAPTNLTLAESITLAGGSVARAKLSVSWTASSDPRVSYYELQDKPFGRDWVAAGLVQGVSRDLFDLAAGAYGFRVRAVSGFGTPSPWLTLESANLNGLSLPPAVPANLRATYVDNTLSLAWDEVQDFRPLRYGVRKGDSWDTALELGTLAHPPFAAHGNGLYEVKSYIGPDAARIYSATAASIEISGATLVSNVIASRDEQADGWPGVFTGTVGKSGALILTGGSSDLLSDPDVIHDPDILKLGGLGDGTYEMAPARYVDNGRVAPCRVTVTWKGTALQVGQDILTTADLLNLPDFLGNGNVGLVEVYPEISWSQIGAAGDVFSLDPTLNPANDIFAETDVFATSFNAWQRYEPGVYMGRVFRGRLVLKTHDAQTAAIGLAFSFSVDVVDRLDAWALVGGVGTSLTNVTVPNTGLTLVFASNGQTVAEPFNGGVGTDLLPHIQITNTNGVNYDFQVASLTAAGCVITANQSGAPVTAPHTNIQIQGY